MNDELIKQRNELLDLQQKRELTQEEKRKLLELKVQIIEIREKKRHEEELKESIKICSKMSIIEAIIDSLEKDRLGYPWNVDAFKDGIIYLVDGRKCRITVEEIF